MSDKKKDKKQEKPSNDLAPEYQWHPALDPDHIFEGEIKLIQEIKKELPIVANETDKFILIFLIARRHDITDTMELLKKFVKLQSSFGFNSTSPPTFTNNVLLQGLMDMKLVIALQAKGARDNHERMLRYFFMGIDSPGDRSTEATYTLLFWQAYYLIQLEPLNAWRNGLTVVVDLKNVGWKNFDMSSKGRAVNKDVQGTFPFRFRSMLVINGGMIISALLGAAKLVVPKKIMSRVQHLDPTDLKEHIPAPHLLSQYEGGGLPLTIDTFLLEVLDHEKSLYEQGIWTKENK